MDNYEKNYLSQRPNLCVKCGLCCRIATAKTPHKKLLEMCEQGDPGAMDFLSVFEPYESIEAARAVSPETVDNFIRLLSEDGNYKEEDTTFYKCKYLDDNNLCTRYEDRLLLCKHFPASPWDIVPPGCGYEGWLFMKREEAKQKIRKIKEELLELQLLKKKTNSPEIQLKIASVEKKMLSNIELFKKHGSENW